MSLFSRPGRAALAALSAAVLAASTFTVVAAPTAHAVTNLAECAGGALTLNFNPPLDRTPTPQTKVTGGTTQDMLCAILTPGPPSLETATIEKVDALGNLSCLASTAIQGTMEIDWSGSTQNSKVALSTLGFNTGAAATVLTLSGSVTSGRFEGAMMEIEAVITNVLDYQDCFDDEGDLDEVNATSNMVIYST